MAIYDWELQTITRSAKWEPSRSAVAAAAYRSGTCLLDHRTGIEHDYTQRRELHSEIVLPPDVIAPTPLRPGSRSELRSQLWNAAEAAETRRNSVVAREITLALPHELSQDDGRRLARVYAGHIANTFGVAVDVAVHPPSRNGDQRNVHAHLMFSTRRLANGFVFREKTRELDAAATGGPIVKDLRERWAAFANLALFDAGFDVSIDHRSLADRGIDRAPGHHVGPKATNQARALRAKAARLLAEAEEIEREVLPLMWQQVQIEEAIVKPERVEEAWIEWASLHERTRSSRAAETPLSVTILEEGYLVPSPLFRPAPVLVETAPEILEAVVRDAVMDEAARQKQIHAAAEAAKQKAEAQEEVDAKAKKKRTQSRRAKTSVLRPEPAKYPNLHDEPKPKRHYEREDLPPLRMPELIILEEEGKPKLKPKKLKVPGKTRSMAMAIGMATAKGRSRGRGGRGGPSR